MGYSNQLIFYLTRSHWYNVENGKNHLKISEIRSNWLFVRCGEKQCKRKERFHPFVLSRPNHICVNIIWNSHSNEWRECDSSLLEQFFPLFILSYLRYSLCLTHSVLANFLCFASEAIKRNIWDVVQINKRNNKFIQSPSNKMRCHPHLWLKDVTANTKASHKQIYLEKFAKLFCLFLPHFTFTSDFRTFFSLALKRWQTNVKIITVYVRSLEFKTWQNNKVVFKLQSPTFT